MLSVLALLRHVWVLGFVSVGSGGENHSYTGSWHFEGKMRPSRRDGDQKSILHYIFPKVEKKSMFFLKRMNSLKFF